MEKQFKRSVSFPKYIISDTGTIINTRSGTIRKKTVNHSGYHVVGMFENGKRVYKLVHRLVAEAYLENDGYPQINHKNGIKTDNRVENLEWCSASHNVLHTYQVLGRKNSPTLLKGGENSKKCIVTKGKCLGVFDSIAKAAKSNDCPKHIFQRISKGKHTHRSHEFEVSVELS
jgi:hypothetical protein